jgi:hypothetical protein
VDKDEIMKTQSKTNQCMKVLSWEFVSKFLVRQRFIFLLSRIENPAIKQIIIVRMERTIPRMG